jgi:hypothetical protein
MKNYLITLLIVPVFVWSQDGIKPIIDVHLHGYTEQSYYVAPTSEGVFSPKSYEEFKNQIASMMEKYNIVKAVNSGGSYDSNLDEKIIPALDVYGKPVVGTLEFKK